MTTLLIDLILLGLFFYLINLIPMAPPFPQIIRVVAVIIGIMLVLQAFGLWTGFPLHY